MMWAATLLSLVIWLYLTLCHHMFWRRREFLPEINPNFGMNPQVDTQNHWPNIISLTPARNEEAVIEPSFRSLLLQNYNGTYKAVLINDNSDDKTREIAENTSIEAETPHPAEILDAPPLHAGWSGKLWALHSGFESIQDADTPDYYWLSDADVTHDPDILVRLVSKARQDNLAMVSLMVTLNCKTFWERLIIPAFIYYFQMLYPFAATANPRSQIAGGAGGCILLRADALEAIGGIAAIKDTLIDDCALAAAIKAKGYNIWLGHGTESRSIRRSAQLKGLWHMVTRTAFTQLSFSYFKLFGAILAMFIIYTIPIMGVISGLMSGIMFGRWGLAALGATAWAIMAITYLPTIRAYGRPYAASLLMPFTAHLFMAMTLHSAWLHFRGSHSGWRGRIYDNHASQKEI